MIAKKPASRTSSAKRGSDLAKVDAHRIAPDEYEDLPELTDEAMARGQYKVAGKRTSAEAGAAAMAEAIRRGRPRLERPKERIALRLDPEVVDHFRATGAGWQSRINTALREVVRRQEGKQERKKA